MREALGKEIVRQLSFSELRVKSIPVGRDYHILVQGGERPHIGCTVLAVPRKSLKGDGSISSSASVINVTGHKDEQICRCLAEAMSAKRNAVVVCSGGFHVDHITGEQINELMGVVREVSEEISDMA